MRNESNKFNTDTFFLHSLTPSRTLRILNNEKFKERLILFFPHQWQRGVPLWPLTKSPLKLSPSSPHWVIGLESLSGDSLGNIKICKKLTNFQVNTENYLGQNLLLKTLQSPDFFSVIK